MHRPEGGSVFMRDFPGDPLLLRDFRVPVTLSYGELSPPTPEAFAQGHRLMQLANELMQAFPTVAGRLCDHTTVFGDQVWVKNFAESTFYTECKSVEAASNLVIKLQQFVESQLLHNRAQLEKVLARVGSTPCLKSVLSPDEQHALSNGDVAVLLNHAISTRSKQVVTSVQWLVALFGTDEEYRNLWDRLMVYHNAQQLPSATIFDPREDQYGPSNGAAKPEIAAFKAVLGHNPQLRPDQLMSRAMPAGDQADSAVAAIRDAFGISSRILRSTMGPGFVRVAVTVQDMRTALQRLRRLPAEGLRVTRTEYRSSGFYDTRVVAPNLMPRGPAGGAGAAGSASEAPRGAPTLASTGLQHAASILPPSRAGDPAIPLRRPPVVAAAFAPAPAGGAGAAAGAASGAPQQGNVAVQSESDPAP